MKGKKTVEELEQQVDGLLQIIARLMANAESQKQTFDALLKKHNQLTQEFKPIQLKNLKNPE